MNYDAWFDYLRLMETECDSTDEIRDCYEKAIANVPPLAEKRSWRRYIYLWINYAIFEELQVKVQFHFDNQLSTVEKICIAFVLGH